MDQMGAPATTAEVPEGSRQADSTTIAQDSNLATMTFRLDSPRTEWMSAIKYIVGYSTVVGGPGTWQLSRGVPARHPYYHWMRATRITNIQGRGGPDTKWTVNTFNGGPWKKLYITVQFEQPLYPMQPDSLGLPEYCRWSIRVVKPNIETLARKFDNGWTFANLPGVANTPGQQFPGDVLLRQPKGILEIKWYDVPESWTHLGSGSSFGGLIPTNISRAVGTVNSRAFPSVLVPVDQNRNTGTVQFPPGTLLMLEPDCKERTRLDPLMLVTSPAQFLVRKENNSGTETVNFNVPSFSNTNFFPRSFDWTFRWLIYDPLYDFTNALQVAPRWDPLQTVNVRGHNLLPLPAPKSTTGVSFYPATNNRNATVAGNQLAGPSGVTGGDQFLLYPYFNHELIFSWARSLSATTGGLWPLDGTFTT